MSSINQGAFVFAVAVALAAIGCGKKDGADTAASASAAPPPPPPPPAEASSSAAPATPTPPVVTTHASLDTCCAALSAIASAGKDATTRTKAKEAALVCPAIAARVKSGQVARSQALPQILSAMTGSTIPGECR